MECSIPETQAITKNGGVPESSNRTSRTLIAGAPCRQRITFA